MSNTYTLKARAARTLLYAENQPGRDILLIACREARDAAPNGAAERHWSKIIETVEQGRAFRSKTYAATYSTTNTDAFDPELVFAVEAVFQEAEQ